jgi:hypothetical protein
MLEACPTGRGRPWDVTTRASFIASETTLTTRDGAPARS